MAVYAALVQTDMRGASGTDVLFNVFYGIVDTVTPKAEPGMVTDIACPMGSPGSWEGILKQAVIDHAATIGYTLTLANLRWYPYVPGDYRPAENPALWTKDATKTNIGSSFINVYTGNAGEGQLVDFFGMKEYRLVVSVNKVGTGTQDAGIMDVTNAANVVSVADAGAAGEHTLDSGWIALAAWMTGQVIVKPVAKSSVAADDPVYRQFALYLR
jgi:hypothetical protein